MALILAIEAGGDTRFLWCCSVSGTDGEMVERAPRTVAHRHPGAAQQNPVSLDGIGTFLPPALPGGIEGAGGFSSPALSRSSGNDTAEQEQCSRFVLDRCSKLGYNLA